MASSDKNVSAGGHVYDRTTGTWVGETQGSFGDGIDHARSGDRSRVIHDANGPVGVQFAPTGPTQQPAAGHSGSGAGGSGAAAGGVQTDGLGSAGSGPGSAAVTTAGPGSGGTGAGSAFAGSVWWDVAGKAPEVPGSFVSVSDLPPLVPIMKGSNSALMIGGAVFMPDPGTSDAGEIEELLGDGDNPTEIAWYVKQLAGLHHLNNNMPTFNLGWLLGPDPDGLGPR